MNGRCVNDPVKKSTRVNGARWGPAAILSVAQRKTPEFRENIAQTLTVVVPLQICHDGDVFAAPGRPGSRVSPAFFWGQGTQG